MLVELRSGAPRVSIVICTYNRSQLLRNALVSLCRQVCSPNDYEVIVVDNNSNDDTARTVRSISKRYPAIVYCRETKMGLAHARNRGWQLAQAPYIGYIDDDAVAPNMWVSRAITIIGQENPDAFGGPYSAFFINEPPAWFPSDYGRMDLGSERRWLGTGEYLSGTNMFYKRKLLERLNGFDADFGMQGTKQRFAEDTEIQIRAVNSIPELRRYYDPELEVQHLVSPQKMKLVWWMRYHYGKGRSRYHLRLPRTASNLTLWRSGLQVLRRMLWRSCTGIVLRDRQQYPFYKTYLSQVVFRDFRHLGLLFSQWQKS